MKRKSYYFYSNLWTSSCAEPHVKVLTSNYESFCKKSLDDLCLKADMCESVDEYVESICTDMEMLIEQGIPKEYFVKHPLVLEKLKRIGQDLMDFSKYESDLYYVGAFIDFKIPLYWFQGSFFSMISGLLKICRDKAYRLSDTIKRKIRNTIRDDDFNLYSRYFISNSFEKSS